MLSQPVTSYCATEGQTGQKDVEGQTAECRDTKVTCYWQVGAETASGAPLTRRRPEPPVQGPRGWCICAQPRSAGAAFPGQPTPVPAGSPAQMEPLTCTTCSPTHQSLQQDPQPLFSHQHVRLEFQPSPAACLGTNVCMTGPTVFGEQYEKTAGSGSDRGTGSAADLERWRAARRSCSALPARSPSGVRSLLRMRCTMLVSAAVPAGSTRPLFQTCWCQAYHMLCISVGSCSIPALDVSCRQGVCFKMALQRLHVIACMLSQHNRRSSYGKLQKW